MKEKPYQGPVFALIIFLLVGAALAGTTSEPESPQYIGINEECADFQGADEDNDGMADLVEDNDCTNYPYSNGNGESNTFPNTVDYNLNYQPLFDLTVDYVRNIIDKGCNNQLNGCLGTNFANEVQFYCWFDQNVMLSADFASMFDKYFNLNHINAVDDGSFNMYLSVCNALPPSSAPTTLPTIEYQASSPIPDNPGGGGEGEGMK